MTITFEALSFWLGILSIVLGVGSITLSVLFYFKSDAVSNRTRDILYEIEVYSKNNEYVTRNITDKVVDVLLSKQEKLTEAGINEQLKKFEDNLIQVISELKEQGRQDLVNNLNNNLEQFKNSVAVIPKVTTNNLASIINANREIDNLIIPLDEYQILNLLYNMNEAVTLKFIAISLNKPGRTIIKSMRHLENMKLINSISSNRGITAYWLSDYGKKVVELSNNVNDSNTVVFKVDSSEYIVNGQIKKMNVTPYIKNDRTYIPLVNTAIGLGVSENNILWNENEQSMVIIRDDRVAKITVDSTEMIINGVAFEMDVPPEIKRGYIVMPIRWIAQMLGCTIDWDNDNNTATVTSS